MNHLESIPSSVLSQNSILAVNSFLARYTGRTYDQYKMYMRLFFDWCAELGVDPIALKRPHLELYVQRYLIEQRGGIPATVNHHFQIIRGFYKFAVIDERLDRDPTVAVKLPKVFHDPYRQDYLTDSELRAFISAGKRAERPTDPGLIALIAIMGFRISEALGVKIEDYNDVMQDHRVIRLVGKGGRPATMPLSPVALRMLRHTQGQRESGILLIRDRSSVRKYYGTPMTYRSARAAIARMGKGAGIERVIAPHMFRRGIITHGLDQGVSLRDMQIFARHSDPRVTASYDRGANNLDRSAVHIVSASLAGGS